MKSPFKFLDPFELTDKNVFFGRDREIEDLYQMIHRSNLILIYGFSGTGKTSLVQCGLAGRFDGPEWFPFFIRRGEDLNLSLRNALSKELGANVSPEKALEDLVEDIYEEYLSNVYLIFDQFEELFLLGTPQEQQQFAQDIQRLLNRELPCKVLFIIREEFLGELYQMERVLPRLFNFKFRVEAMNHLRINEVLQSSFSAFNIELEPPAEERRQAMIDSLSSGRSVVQLPYLQVYLDMLWEGVYGRISQEENDSLKSNAGYPHLTFSQSDIEELGDIKAVLQRFMSRQVVEVEEVLCKKYPKAKIEQEVVNAVLNVFVTDEGTKQPIPFEQREREGKLIFPSSWMEKFPIANPMLTDCIHLLEKSRILRLRDDSCELAHDSLAALIFEDRTEEEKRHNRIRQEIRVFQRTGQYLSRELLNSYQEDLVKMTLDTDLASFVNKSDELETARERHEQQRSLQREEMRQRELELTREKLAAEEKAGRRKRRFSVVTSFVALIAIAFLFLAVQKYEENKNLIFEGWITKAQSYKENKDYEQAFRVLKDRKFLNLVRGIGAGKKSRLDSIQNKWRQLQELTTTADSLKKSDSFEKLINDWPAAYGKYKEAHELDPDDQRVEETLEQIGEAIEVKGKEVFKKAGLQYSLEAYCIAKTHYESANKLNENYENEIFDEKDLALIEKRLKEIYSKIADKDCPDFDQ